MHTAPSTQHKATRPPTASTFKPRVRRLGPGRYLVESASTPGVGHQVTAASCGCRAGQFGKPCRHVKLVAAIERAMGRWYAQGEAQAKAARAATRPAGMTALQEAFGA